MEFLKIENLNVKYGKILALKGVNITIQEGRIVSLVGANGAGKSTLLKTISGILAPTDGSVFYNGQNITQSPPSQRVKMGIAQVPEGRGLFGVLSVEDNLLLGAYTKSKKESYEELQKIYEIFPILKDKKDEFAGTLSGGQQQMVAVGRALMSRPRLLLLDEPSMGLAPVIVDEIFNIIKELNKGGTSIFIVEQNAQLALKNSHYTYVIENGSIVAHDKSSSLLNDDTIKTAYLGDK